MDNETVRLLQHPWRIEHCRIQHACFIRQANLFHCFDEAVRLAIVREIALRDPPVDADVGA